MNRPAMGTPTTPLYARMEVNSIFSLFNPSKYPYQLQVALFL
ncbi:MAG: hypothetical protein Q8M08_03085 [Bacteroidales bacterium]|nr:hypothetical protein [Bacteroidales bacterium]